MMEAKHMVKDMTTPAASELVKTTVNGNGRIADKYV
jgi:hypothetical protein